MRNQRNPTIAHTVRPVSGERDDDAAECQRQRHADARRLDDLSALVTCGRGTLEQDHVGVELSVMDGPLGYTSRAIHVVHRVIVVAHGLVIRSPNSFFHSS